MYSSGVVSYHAFAIASMYIPADGTSPQEDYQCDNTSNALQALSIGQAPAGGEIE